MVIARRLQNADEDVAQSVHFGGVATGNPGSESFAIDLGVEGRNLGRLIVVAEEFGFEVVGLPGASPEKRSAVRRRERELCDAQS